MSIKRLLFAVGVVNAFGLVFILVIFVMQSGKMKARTERMINIDQELLLDLNNMYSQGLQSGQATRNVLINPDDEKAKSNYKDAQEGFVKSNAESLKLSSGTMTETLKKAGALWEEDGKLKGEVQALAGSDKRNEAIELLTRKETPKWREVRSLLLEMMKEQKGSFREHLAENERAMRNGTILLSCIIAFALIGFSSFLFFINNRMQKNMTQALECLGTLERGEFKEECKIVESSNFLKDIYNRILLTLRETILNISSVAKSVSQNVNALAEDINQLDSGAKEQLSKIDQVASATAEMSQTIVDVAKNASFASEMAKGAADIADKGTDTVRRRLMQLSALRNQ